MRITAGQYKGRVLETPQGRDIRPTSDKVRQAIFNMLEARAGLDGKTVLDGFCGSGALGLEALSRGASHAVLLDKSGISLSLAKRNATTLGAFSLCEFIKADCTKTAQRNESAKKADLVFLDPPYEQALLEKAFISLMHNRWMEEAALIVAEMAKREDVVLPDCDMIIEKIYGDTKVRLFSRRLP